MELEKDPQKAIINPVRQGSIDFTQIGGMGFPFEAWEYSNPKSLSPTLRLKAPWKLLLSSLVADGSVEGITGIAYHQPLAPTPMYLNDTWEDTDTGQTHKVVGGDISTYKGGAPANETPVVYYGGAPADEAPVYLNWGKIPADVGWVKDGTHAGTTLIDGGQIETDSLKSHNYVPGVSGSKFDLENGFIETGDGVFRGDMEIGSDEAERNLKLGSKGLLVTNKDGEVIHDLPDASLGSHMFAGGHFYFLDDYYAANVTMWDYIIPATTSTSLSGSLIKSMTLTNLGYSSLEDSNIKGVNLYVQLYYYMNNAKYQAQTTSVSGSRLYSGATAYGVINGYSRYFGGIVYETGNSVYLRTEGNIVVPRSDGGSFQVYLNYNATALSTNSAGGRLIYKCRAFGVYY